MGKADQEAQRVVTVVGGPNYLDIAGGLANRIHNLEVKCENLEAENKQQAEEIFRLNSQVVELKRSEGTIYSGLNTSRDWEAKFERHLEALEERLAKPKDGVII